MGRLESRLAHITSHRKDLLAQDTSSVYRVPSRKHAHCSHPHRGLQKLLPSRTPNSQRHRSYRTLSQDATDATGALSTSIACSTRIGRGSTTRGQRVIAICTPNIQRSYKRQAHYMCNAMLLCYLHALCLARRTWQWNVGTMDYTINCFNSI